MVLRIKAKYARKRVELVTSFPAVFKLGVIDEDEDFFPLFGSFGFNDSEVAKESKTIPHVKCHKFSMITDSDWSARLPISSVVYSIRNTGG